MICRVSITTDEILQRRSTLHSQGTEVLGRRGGRGGGKNIPPPKKKKRQPKLRERHKEAHFMLKY